MNASGHPEPGRAGAGFVALVPARGNSKGIPGKNLQEVGGVPLVARSVRVARGAARIARVLVSTDDQAIARVAREAGAEVPFLRPAELAADDTPTADVLRHAWEHLARGEGCEPAGIVLLQPTSPFVTPRSVERAVDAFLAGDAPTLKAVRAVRDHPSWLLREEGGYLVPYLERAAHPAAARRQDLAPLFVPCGAIYIYGRAYFRQPGADRRAAWVELPWPETLDIDSPDDLETARALYSARSGGC